MSITPRTAGQINTIVEGMSHLFPMAMGRDLFSRGSGPHDWLPGQMSESVVLWDAVVIAVRRIARGEVRILLLTP